jgi:hypothetical protein
LRAITRIANFDGIQRRNFNTVENTSEGLACSCGSPLSSSRFLKNTDYSCSKGLGGTKNLRDRVRENVIENSERTRTRATNTNSIQRPVDLPRIHGYTLALLITAMIFIFSLLFVFGLPLYTVLSGQAPLGRDYRTADRSSAGIAPPAETTPEAVVQVYGARALNWRGIFGVHTWIATKPPDATQYTVHHVIGWRAYRNLPVVVSAPGIPDGRWFGNEPELILDIRGDLAAGAIPKILEAAATYPYADEYQLWPGPNSNTFMAYVGRQVPELKMDLPATAIGKDYPINGSMIDRSPSGTGYQLSLLGVFGITLAREEGIELNLLGLSFGVDILKPALKLPFIGRLGVSEF